MAWLRRVQWRRGPALSHAIAPSVVREIDVGIDIASRRRPESLSQSVEAQGSGESAFRAPKFDGDTSSSRAGEAI